MEFAKLGNTDLIVSRLCLGCMGFGDAQQGQHDWTLNQKETKEIIKKVLDTGVNFLDTAIGYSNGTSEEYVGKALKELTQRDKVVIATKFLPRSEKEIQKGEEHIKKSCETSLKNLGTDYIDLYIYHMWDYQTPLFDIMQGLNNLIKEGKVRALGISNCFAWQLAEANSLADKEKFEPFNCVQGHYNLIFREEEREMIPYCHMKNIALTPYSSLAAGRLSRTPDAKPTNRFNKDNYAKGKYDATQDEDQKIINRVYELSQKYKCSMSAISLSWLLSKVTSPIVGVTKKNQIKVFSEVFDLDISPKDLAYLEQPYVPHELVGVMKDNNPYLTTRH